VILFSTFMPLYATAMHVSNIYPVIVDASNQMCKLLWHAHKILQWLIHKL